MWCHMHFFLAMKEALLVAVATEGEKCVKALLKNNEVTFTRSSDAVITDVIRKYLHGLFLQAVVRSLDSINCVSILDC